MMTFGSLFSGIDGFAEGLEKVGMELKWQVEINDYCQKILKQDWPDVPKFKDIREVGKHNLETVDLICGGFPCQPFSVAGKRRGKEDDRYLWPEMLRVIQEIKPAWIFAENVPGILHIDDGMVFESVLSSLEDEGYEITSFIIPACAVDAPHRRDRVWILAYSIDSTNRTLRREERKKNEIQGVNRQEMGSGMSRRTSDARHEDVAYSDATGERRDEREKKTKENVADSDLQGLEIRLNKPNKQALGRTIKRPDRWLPEPGICRVVNGIPNRKNRLEALGNAVVPQLVKMIGKSIIYSNQCMNADGPIKPGPPVMPALY